MHSTNKMLISKYLEWDKILVFYLCIIFFKKWEKLENNIVKLNYSKIFENAIK